MWINALRGLLSRFLLVPSPAFDPCPLHLSPIVCSNQEKPKDNHHGDDGTGYKNSDHHSSHNDHHDDNNDHGNFHGPSRPTATSVQIGPRRSFSPHHEHHAGGRYPLEPQPSFGSGASIAEDGGDVAQFGERRERKGSKRAKVVEQKEKVTSYTFWQHMNVWPHIAE